MLCHVFCVRPSMRLLQLFCAFLKLFLYTEGASLGYPESRLLQSKNSRNEQARMVCRTVCVSKRLERPLQSGGEYL
jgi:hypothetical protein